MNCLDCENQIAPARLEAIPDTEYCVDCVDKNSTPTIPASGTVGTQQYNEFRPKKRYVQGGDVLNFITPDTNAYIGVSLRQLQG